MSPNPVQQSGSDATGSSPTGSSGKLSHESVVFDQGLSMVVRHPERETKTAIIDSRLSIITASTGLRRQTIKVIKLVQ